MPLDETAAGRLMDLLREGLRKRGLDAQARIDYHDTHLWVVLRRDDVGEVFLFKTLAWWESYLHGDPEGRRAVLKELVDESRMRISVRTRKVLGPDR
ncbi:MAG: hypothetical protein ACUVXD_05455 [Thermodesulfobacteriota bacterium]